METAEIETFLEKQQLTYSHTKQNNDLTLSNKIDALKQKQFNNLGFTYNESWLENKTNIEFPKESKWLLSLGKKFAIPTNPKKIPIAHLIAEVEECIKTIRDEKERDLARNRFTHRLIEYKRGGGTKNERATYILKVYTDTQKLLYGYKNDIVITSADKGNKTVILYRTEYISKMQEIIGDKNTYKTMRNDPTNKLQRQNNKMINDLFKDNQISEQLKIKLNCNSAAAPRLYGLPKIHKKDTPLRPISSSIHVPCYKLSKHIGEILKNLISEEYNVKNATQVKEELKVLTLKEDDVVISFDAVSLFTNIPIYLAIKIIMKKWSTLSQHTDIKRNDFLKILNFCLNDNNYFMLDKTIYNQVFGMPMGNPLSPYIADIVLDYLLDETIHNLKQKNITITKIFKYVDDILAVVNKNDCYIILAELNSHHKKLQFTVEEETNNTLAYLDMKIIRNNNKLHFDWYTKPTSSGRILNYFSDQPTHHKINTAKNLINKITTISDEQFINNNFIKIRDILTNNNYPIKLTNKIINNAKSKINDITVKNQNNNSSQNKETNVRYMRIPYIKKLTANKHIKKIISNDEIIFAHRPVSTLNTIFTKTKTPINKEQQSNIVYQISCKGNVNPCSKIYIGTTKRSLGTRTKEHESDIKTKKETTALAQHIKYTGHTADLQSAKIIDRENNHNIRTTLESLHIQKNIRKTMNKKEDVDNISSIYNILLT